jgi:hypothetical protein
VTTAAGAGIRFFTTGYDETRRQVRTVRDENRELNNGLSKMGPDVERGSRVAVGALSQIERRHARAVMVSLNLLEAMLGPPATTAAEDEAWLRDQLAALRFDDSGGA